MFVGGISYMTTGNANPVDMLLSLVGLQGRNELFQLGQCLLVVDGQQHPGLDIHQVGSHGYKLAGNLQIQLPSPVHPGQILVQDQGELNVLYLHLVFGQQMEDQIQGTHKVLHPGFLCLYHPFQVVDRTVQSVPPNASQKK